MEDEFLLGATSRAWAEEHRGLGALGIAAMVRELVSPVAATGSGTHQRVA